MSTHAVEQVDEWESRPFSGGYRGLHDLADELFSGIVTVGPTRLCMTKGTVVGILDGSIESFEGASGTVHEAPSPALPLLAVMQERSDEVRAQYYTEETPIQEVDATLSDGNFTGFLELSENVLSGDYYTVYHQGRSMSVAFVGTSKQLLTDEEAFERANDEVGIYKVKQADIDSIEIPEPTGDTGTETGTGTEAETETETEATTESETETRNEQQNKPTETTGSTDATTGPVETTDTTTTNTTNQPSTEPETETQTQAQEQSQSRSQSQSQSQANNGDMADGTAATEANHSQTDSASAANPDAAKQREQPPTEPQSPESRANSHTQANTEHGNQSTHSQPKQQQSKREQPPGTDAQARGGSGGSKPASELETRSIPSLDPARTSSQSSSQAGPGPTAGQKSQPQSGRRDNRIQPDGTRQGENQQRSSHDQPAEKRGRQRSQSQSQSQSNTPSRNDAGAGASGEPAADQSQSQSKIDALQSKVAERDEQIETLEAKLETVRSERDELQDRIQSLEERINDIRTEGGGESVANRDRMNPGRAMDETNLFIRYGSKGDPTLEEAYAGEASKEDVNANLEIQHHTGFEADNVAVNGEPFREFLEETIEFRFVQWIVRVLPYEIRETGHEGELKDLYEILPQIDRAELNGTVSVVYEEDGEKQRSQEQFGVVLRDKMGNPLAVANLNESRDPASQNMMEGLITTAQQVGESNGSLSGAFLVTSSFFEPEAMEAATQATGGGLLSRDKRESFVKLSRKDGFHLCLVEAREEQFNLSVPEI